jgi:hypothetical protein
MKSSHAHRSRGTVLIVAMLFAALLAVALSSYVALNTHSLKMANRSFYAIEAVNMAENAIEEAIWSFNQFNAGVTTAWDGWNISGGGAATRTFTDMYYGANATGSVNVYIDHYNPAAGVQPTVVAQARVILPGGGQPVTKVVEVKLKRRTMFAGGLVALKSISFNGNNASVDSWISDPDHDPATAAVAYSAGVRRDKGSIGAASGTSTISIGNADIWGTAAVGGVSTAAISVGSNGTVGPFGTASGVKNPAYLATDFTTNIEPISNPASGALLSSVGAALGADGTTTAWRAPSITGNLTVHGNVTLVLTAGPGSAAISLTGNNGITLAPGATLIIYTEGDVALGGNGLLNGSAQTDTFQLWGTSQSAFAQNIQIAGNGALKGVIYAPNGNVTISGNGDVMGAVVGKTITVAGNAAFHYDESLANWGATTPFGVTRWRELVLPADRATYAAQLAF